MSRRVAATVVALTLIPLLAGCGASSGVRAYNDPFEGPGHFFVLYLDAGHLTAVAARRTQRHNELELLFVARGQYDAVVPAGTEVELLIGGTAVRWPTSAAAQPVSNVFGYTVITQWKLLMRLDEAQMATLASAPLTAVRAPIGGEPYTLQLNARQAQVVHQNLNTLLTGSI